MIVEDEAVIALGLEKRLTEMGYEVVGIFHSGEAAVENARSLLPDLILMDIMIPGDLNGIDAAKIGREELDIPVIFLTAYSEDKFIERAKKARPYGYLVKPVRDRELKATIEIALYKKKFEKALRESEENFKALAENANDGILIATEDGKFVYANRHTAEMAGYSVSELLKTTIDDLVHPNEIRKIKERYRTIIAGKPFQRKIEATLIRKDGAEVIVEVTSTRFIWYGQPSDLVILRDVSHRKQIERTLQESEERYRTIFEQSINAILIFDPNTGMFFDFNDRACLGLGYTRQEFKNIKISDFEAIESEEEVARHIENILKDGEGLFETKHRTKNGEIRNVLVSSRVISIRGKDFIQSIFRDITEQKMAGEALKKSRDDLEHRVEERTIELQTALEGVALSEKELNQRKSALEEVNRQLLEANQALSVLARNIDKEKEGLEKRIYQITSSKIMPIVKELQEDERCSRRLADLEVLATHLKKMTSGSSLYDEIDTSLTDQELRVAVMIKNGLTSHQIGDLLCISLHTVKTHRKNIRKKLKIDNTQVNLVSFLKSKIGSDSM